MVGPLTLTVNALSLLGILLVVLVFHRLRLPSLPGFIVAGLLYLPFLWTTYLSFTRYRGLGSPEWVGLDNYQAVAFTELWHNPKAPANLGGLKVVAAFPAGSKDIEESVRELPKWTEGIKKLGVEVVKSPEDVLKQVDAVLVMSIDGRAHLEQLKVVLKAGKPVFIDKPVAGSLADALKIVGKPKCGSSWPCHGFRLKARSRLLRSHQQMSLLLQGQSLASNELKRSTSAFARSSSDSV